MRKLIAPAAVALSLVFAGVTAAQSTDAGGMTQEKTTEKKVTTPGSPTTKEKTVSVIGTVKEYDAGKDIEISTSNHKTKKFDLAAKDTTATIDPAVAVGSKVKVIDRNDNGSHTITVEPYVAKTTKHKAKSGTAAAAPASTRKS